MIELLTPQLSTHRSGDALTIQSDTPLPEPARCVGDWLVSAAQQVPDVTFLAEPDPAGGWIHLSYGDALERVEALASGLLSLGVGSERPVMILADNSVDAALIALAAMHVGVPAAPVSSAYALRSTTFDRLRWVASQLQPCAIFVADPAPMQAALAALDLDGVHRLCAAPHDGWLSLDALAASERAPGLEAAFAATGPDTIAKILFTSGSTGRPRGVVNTQRMLTANQQSMAAAWPFLERRPPVIVDWLPWSHTFGGNHNFFMVLRNRGTLYIDPGRPVPGLIERTVENLAAISPTLWFNVPRGFDQAVAVLEARPELAEGAFANLDLIFYAAAALSPSTRARLEAIAGRVGRTGIFFTSAWGSTETAPLATSAHFETSTTGNLGVPVPGVQLRLAPVQDRLELRVRGPNVTPGYWRPGGTIAPIELDEDGFLPTGDAGELIDEARPEAGVRFAGRIGENFKLSSGTWVVVGPLREKIVDACAPLLLDAVIAGHNHPSIGLLLFPTAAALQLPPEALRQRLADALTGHNQAHPGNSERIRRALIVTTPLSLDAGETTDKGYTNQGRVLQLRAGAVERLFAEPAGDEVIVLG